MSLKIYGPGEKVTVTRDTSWYNEGEVVEIKSVTDNYVPIYSVQAEGEDHENNIGSEDVEKTPLQILHELSDEGDTVDIIDKVARIYAEQYQLQPEVIYPGVFESQHELVYKKITAILALPHAPVPEGHFESLNYDSGNYVYHTILPGCRGGSDYPDDYTVGESIINKPLEWFELDFLNKHLEAQKRKAQNKKQEEQIKLDQERKTYLELKAKFENGTE